MKKIVLTIYHTGASKYHIRFILTLIRKMAGVQIIEISETEIQEVENKRI